jgi:hypothetical protein
VAYLVKRIEQAHVLWFEPSNQWAQLNGQQWFIFSQFIKKTPKEEVVKKSCRRFSLPAEQALLLVDNLFDSIPKLLNPDFDLPNFTHNTKEALKHTLPKSKTRSYCYSNKKFKISYGSPFLEQYIHLPLAHLESDFGKDSFLKIDVYSFENRYALRVNGVTGKCLVADEPGQIKRLIYIELANYFFDKCEDDWMTFIHGSALRKNDKLLVLTSEGGSGKSTMAGLLQLHGFDYFSDDFIPVDIKSLKAFPFPAALCIKNNAISLLESKGLGFNIKTAKQTAYADFKTGGFLKSTAAVNNVVFIKYAKGSELSFEPISTLDALSLFLQEAWVGNDMKRARKFINWFTKLKFFKLEFSNSEKAIQVLSNLMKGGE